MSTTTSKSPYYWNVPTQDKDYVHENVQRIRRTPAQNKNREPMKAAFIPGVTKSAKYAHVTSKLSELLTQPNFGRPPANVSNGGLQNGKGPPIRAPQQRGMPVNRRLSRSFTDLRGSRGKESNNKTENAHSHNNASSTSASAPPDRKRGQITVDGPGNYVPHGRRKPRGELLAEDESVYNWRFSDNSVPSNLTPIQTSQSHPNIKSYHRVEYLPCDGICADETVDYTQPESGRSSSRTSRGINTEETRIIQKNMQCLGLGSSPATSLEALDNFNHTSSQSELPSNSCPPGSKDHFMHSSSKTTMHNGDMHHSGVHGTTGASNKVGFAADSTRKVEGLVKHAATTTTSLASLGGTNAVNIGRGKSNVHSNIYKNSGELPHTLGTVPKYLRQRQDEWKSEAAERAAAASSMHPDIPPGHILLPERERVETLHELKTKYSMLIDELNRVPIRIDTMRVREHKIQLEQQLQKLEKGISIFSRARVFVKVPDPINSMEASSY